MKKDLLLLILLVVPSFSQLLRPGYFPMHDDLQTLRQYELDKCLADGQIPCRWVPDMGYGYGYPLFNFYPPLPYFIGLVFRSLQFNYIDTVKLVGVTGFAVTAIGMYLLGRELWNRRGGFLSSLLYTYAPYHSTDFYVRGAMNEFWAMAFYPFIFYTSLRLIRAPNVLWLILTALSLTGLMLSHNPMLMIFAPVFACWVLFWLLKYRRFQPFVYLTGSGLTALGLSAFFTLPVLLEQKYAHVETLIIGYFNYLAHYLSLPQIFLHINWNYGESIYGPGDTMSFALGYLQWLLPLCVLVFLPFTKALRSRFGIVVLLLVLALGTLFLTHFRSAPIWALLPPLHFLQFPWRFLTVSVFLFALVAGAVVYLFKSRWLFSLVLVLIIATNGIYFLPRTWYPTQTDTEKFTGRSWQWLVTSGIFDYLPIWAKLPPADPPVADLVFTSGSGQFVTRLKNSHQQIYDLGVTTPDSVIQVQTFYFPGWQAWLDNQIVPLDPTQDPDLGRIMVSVATGRHELVLRFTSTPIRQISNLVSLVSWAGVAIALLYLSFIKLRRHG